MQLTKTVELIIEHRDDIWREIDTLMMALEGEKKEDKIDKALKMIIKEKQAIRDYLIENILNEDDILRSCAQKILFEAYNKELDYQDAEVDDVVGRLIGGLYSKTYFIIGKDPKVNAIEELDNYCKETKEPGIEQLRSMSTTAKKLLLSAPTPEKEYTLQQKDALQQLQQEMRVKIETARKTLGELKKGLLPAWFVGFCSLFYLNKPKAGWIVNEQERRQQFSATKQKMALVAQHVGKDLDVRTRS